MLPNQISNAPLRDRALAAPVHQGASVPQATQPAVTSRNARAGGLFGQNKRPESASTIMTFLKDSIDSKTFQDYEAVIGYVSLIMSRKSSSEGKGFVLASLRSTLNNLALAIKATSVDPRKTEAAVGLVTSLIAIGGDFSMMQSAGLTTAGFKRRFKSQLASVMETLGKSTEPMLNTKSNGAGVPTKKQNGLKEKVKSLFRAKPAKPNVATQATPHNVNAPVHSAQQPMPGQRNPWDQVYEVPSPAPGQLNPFIPVYYEVQAPAHGPNPFA